MRIILPFATGGNNDIVARLIGQWLSERLSRPFIVENRPGGGGNIGTDAVVNAPPDGYTLLLVSTVRIPTKPAMHSNMKPATCSDPKPTGVPN